MTGSFRVGILVDAFQFRALQMLTGASMNKQHDLNTSKRVPMHVHLCEIKS